MMINIALIGPPGVGKRTQADRLTNRFDLNHIATGDLFQENLVQLTALGILARRYMALGELVPDEIVDAMLEEKLIRSKQQQGILLEGFPRTVFQATFLDEMFTKMDRKLDAVIYLQASDEVVTQRLVERVNCRLCDTHFHNIYHPFRECTHHRCQGEYLYRHHNSDEIAQQAKAALRTFHRSSEEVINYYQNIGKLIVVDGEKNLSTVNRSIIDAMDSVLRRQFPVISPAQSAQLHPSKPIVTPTTPIHPSLDIVFVGAPGSGKGTQATRLSQQLNLPHIATGDLFRENLKNKTELGKLAQSYMNRGELVPDDVTESMVQERLARSDAQQGYILDGFPRNLDQAKALNDIMLDLNRRVDAVLYIKVPDEDIVNRLSGRVICRECQTPFHNIFQPFATCPHERCHGEHLYQRDDDNVHTVSNRLKTFHTKTTPLLDYYKEEGMLVDIEGVGDVADITARIRAAIETVQQKNS